MTNDKGVRIPPTQAALAKGEDIPGSPAVTAAPVTETAAPTANSTVPVAPDIAALVAAEVQKILNAPPAPPAPRAGPNGEAIPRNLFSGLTLRLAVHAPDGTPIEIADPENRYYWFLDEGGQQRIANARVSGWSMVKRSEVLINDETVSSGNTDTGDNVRVSYGIWPNGAVKQHYLMKKAKWLDAEHGKDRERIHEGLENQLRNGTLEMGNNEKRYTATNNPHLPNSPTILPPIRLNQSRSS